MSKAGLEELEKYVVKHPRVALGLSALALGYVGLKSLCFLKTSFLAFARREYNLQERYGRGSWAVVTGASDGIGKQYCLSLAQRGFNIVLIARNKTKLEAAESEIKTQSPGVSTRIVIADFEQSVEAGFFERIVEQINDLDISILVNNAGVALLSYFEKETQAHLRSMLNVNVYPVVLLTNLLLPKMLQRSHRSAVINISSGLGTLPVPYATIYSASKALVDFFSRAIDIELGHKIDVLSHLCATVSTKMNGYEETGFFVLTPKVAVEGILKVLGKEPSSSGNWRHKIMNGLLPVMPIKEELRKKIDGWNKNI
eukprot:TRINITY_DN3385_c0_g2_i3.p1 TRINITY_DN3385_c0_g2~~TRINITY_DN3385_c0_g2_i3.p1  ORF type:complete len:313 (-),score=77.40 TRINITY_DN3385_c0_g2_i3:99-1037(-)